MYTKEIIQIENITIEKLKIDLLVEFQQLLQNFFNQQEKVDELLTREQTAKLLKISLVTLHVWTKKNIVPAYRIGNKVRYKKGEVLASLRQMNGF
jgi:excisionase family DNA binding protein